MTDTKENKYEWIEYSRSLQLPKNTDSKRNKAENVVNELIKDCVNCAQHSLEYMIFTTRETRYRKYRRGKNRCKRCGVKI